MKYLTPEDKQRCEGLVDWAMANALKDADAYDPDTRSESERVELATKIAPLYLQAAALYAQEDGQDG